MLKKTTFIFLILILLFSAYNSFGGGLSYKWIGECSFGTGGEDKDCRVCSGSLDGPVCVGLCNTTTNVWTCKGEGNYCVSSRCVLDIAE